MSGWHITDLFSFSFVLWQPTLMCNGTHFLGEMHTWLARIWLLFGSVGVLYQHHVLNSRPYITIFNNIIWWLWVAVMGPVAQANFLRKITLFVTGGDNSRSTISSERTPATSRLGAKTWVCRPVLQMARKSPTHSCTFPGWWSWSTRNMGPWVVNSFSITTRCNQSDCCWVWSSRRLWPLFSISMKW